MAMREAEVGLRNTGDPRDAAFADVIKGIREARGKDIPLRETAVNLDPLSLAIAEYNADPTNPDALTKFLKLTWEDRQVKLWEAGEGVKLTLPEPQPVYTEGELKELEQEGRRVGYLPFELATQENRHLMAKIWPQMQSHSVQEGNSVTNEFSRGGHFDYEVAIDAPYLNTIEQDLLEGAEDQSLAGMNLNEYIVAGQDSKLLTGKYLDQDRTWVRLLGSRREGRVVDARFGPSGRLLVDSALEPDYHDGGWGGRLVGAFKAA